MNHSSVLVDEVGVMTMTFLDDASLAMLMRSARICKDRVAANAVQMHGAALLVSVRGRPPLVEGSDVYSTPMGR